MHRLGRFYLKHEKLFFGLFMLFCSIVYVALMIRIPYEGAPDEKMRYQISDFIFRNGTLPRGEEESLRDPIWGNSYGFTPITSYIISALFMKITSFFTTDFTALLMSARLVSVVCSVATIFFVILIVQLSMKEKYSQKWLILFLVSLLPSFIIISSYVNIDAFTVATTAVVIYSWVLGIKTAWNYKSCIVMATGLGLLMISYYNAYGYIICSVFLFYMSMFFGFEKKAKDNKIVKKTFLIIGVTFLFCGWWFIRNAILHNGDFLGLDTCNYYGELYGDAKHKPSALETPLKLGQSLWYMFFDRGWLGLTLQYGFIGIFGQNDVLLLPRVYIFYWVVFIIGAIGCLVGGKKLFPGLKDKKSISAVLFHSTMIVAIIIPIIIAIIYSYAMDFQRQGRYVLPAIIPFMYFIGRGIYMLCSKIFRGNKLKHVFPVIAMLGILISTYFCFKYTFMVVYPSDDIFSKIINFWRK